MKCKALNQADINLVKVEQDRKAVTVAVRESDGTYSYKDVAPLGRRKNIIDKYTKPKCTCSAQTISGFQCPKVGSSKEGGLRMEHGSVWRVTPVCFTVQKL
jgi:hypothetical protein